MKPGCLLVAAIVAATLVLAQDDAPAPEVHVFGSYEGGSADVELRHAERPVILVLTAYESMHWRIKNPLGLEIERVIASGYHRQTVDGVPDGVPLQVLDYATGAQQYFHVAETAPPNGMTDAELAEVPENLREGLREADAERIERSLKETAASFEKARRMVMLLTGRQPTTIQSRYHRSDFKLRHAGAYPDDAEVHAIGVYEGDSTVHVGRVGRPIVLVLTAYEKARWTVEIEPGVRLAGAILGGHHDQAILGMPDATTVLETGFRAREEGTARGAYLVERVQELTGKKPASFQSAYTGTTFNID